MAKNDKSVRRLQREAWIGDAVLGLFVRSYILRKDRTLDGAKFARLTSNDYLKDIGDPTAVEAEIGRVHESDGLDHAFSHIEEKLLPTMIRRERSYLRALQQRGEAKKRKSKRSRWLA